MKRMNLSRRDFLRMSALAAAGTALASCAPKATQATQPTEEVKSPTQAPPPEQEVTITFMGWGGVEEDEGVQAAIKVFQEEKPKIKVTWMYTPDLYDEKMNTYIAAGTPPDTAFISEGAYPTYAKDSLLMDITDKIAADPLIGKADYFIEPLEKNRSLINGKWYGIGSCWTNFHIYYNADIFKDAGIEPPSNDPEKAWEWTQFKDVARQLTLDNNGKHPGESGFDLANVKQWGAWWANDWAGPFINIPMVNDGHFYDPDAGKFTLDQAADYEALQNVADLMLVEHVSPQVAAFSGLGMSASQMLENRKLAMAIDGSWALSWMWKIKATLGTAVLPKMAARGTFARAHSHAAFKSTKQADASWEWVRFLATPFYESQFCKMGLWLPNQTSMMTEEGLKTWMDPQVHPKGYEMIVKDYMNKDAKTFLYPLHWNEAYNDLIKPGLDAVWNGDKKAKDVFTEVTPQANAVIEKL
jgi:multiple sugar transport system substrate-binding protein